MVPKIIHYCWFGGKSIPDNLKAYMATWQEFMPEWQYMEWNEKNFEIAAAPIYVQQAYELRKFAFVSDYVRLWALEQYGGVYLDTDVEVLRPFDALLNDNAFIGFEESLAHLPGTCVMGCKAHCQWIKDMLATYDGATFTNDAGIPDMTTNVVRLGRKMVSEGLVANGKEQIIDKWGLHVYTHDYFSPITSTRVMRKSKNTYTIHHFAGSWTNSKHSWWRNSLLIREIVNALIQVKRKLKGIR